MSAFRTIDIMWMISSVNIDSITIKWYLAESKMGSLNLGVFSNTLCLHLGLFEYSPFVSNTGLYYVSMYVVHLTTHSSIVFRPIWVCFLYSMAAVSAQIMPFFCILVLIIITLVVYFRHNNTWPAKD